MKKLLIVYLRLSKEDRLAEDESNSITNQRCLIHSYIKRHSLDRLYRVQEYVDDGYTGKNLERPGITEVLRLAADGKAGMVIVKDFSRLARDYVLMGDLIEKLFPSMQVRFAAVSNHYDSLNHRSGAPDMGVSFLNLIYDYYSEETSEKIHQIFEKKRRRGDHFGNIPPFGYRFDPSNSAHLIRDYEASALVRWLFHKHVRHKMGKLELVRILNHAGVPAPSVYLQDLGYKTPKLNQYWTAAALSRVLADPVHIGVIVSGKFRVKETGSNKKRVLPRDQWMVSWEMHEPNVELEVYIGAQLRDRTEFRYIFDNAGEEKLPSYALPYLSCGTQIKTKQGIYAIPDAYRSSSVKGKIYCGQCRHKMERRYRSGITYRCRRAGETDQLGCMRGSIEETVLEEAALCAVTQQIRQADDLNAVILVAETLRLKSEAEIHKQTMTCKRRWNRIKSEQLKCYQQFREGTIDREQYMLRKNELLSEMEKADGAIRNLAAEQQLREERRSFHLDLSGKGAAVRELTPELAEALIDRIYVYDRCRIEIVFRFVSLI